MAAEEAGRRLAHASTERARRHTHAGLRTRKLTRHRLAARSHLRFFTAHYFSIHVNANFAKVARAFSHFDKNHNGYICRRELREVLRKSVQDPIHMTHGVARKHAGGRQSGQKGTVEGRHPGEGREAAVCLRGCSSTSCERTRDHSRCDHALQL